MANLSALAEGWRDRAVVELVQQLARLQSTGITFAVIVQGNDQRDSGWSAFCYRYLNPQNMSESVSSHKQRLVGSRLEDDPSSQALEWPTWQPLGSIVKVEAFASAGKFQPRSAFVWRDGTQVMALMSRLCTATHCSQAPTGVRSQATSRPWSRQACLILLHFIKAKCAISDDIAGQQRASTSVMTKI